MRNTARKLTAYESLAARCRSGGSLATSVAEWRIFVINYSLAAAFEHHGQASLMLTHLVSIGSLNAFVKLRVENGLKESG